MTSALRGDLLRFALALLLILGAAAPSLVLAEEKPGTFSSESDWIPDDNDEFLRMLKAKDASLNSVRVTVQQNKTIKRSPFDEYVHDSFAAFKYGGDPPPRPESYEPFERETSATITMTLENGDTTIERTSMFDGRGEPLSEPSRARTSNASGKTECTITTHGESLTVEKVTPLEERGLFYEARLQLEFALGVGFGSRLESIEKIERNGAMARVHATMQIWTQDITEAVLLVDSDLIVREATLVANSKGHVTRFEVRTSGTVTSPDHGSLAAASTYKRTSLGILRNGKLEGKSRVVDDYSTEDHEVIAILPTQQP